MLAFCYNVLLNQYAVCNDSSYNYLYVHTTNLTSYIQNIQGTY